MPWCFTLKGEVTAPMEWVRTDARGGCSLYGIVDGSAGRLWLATLTNEIWVKFPAFDLQFDAYSNNSRCSFVFELHNENEAVLFKTFWC